MKKYTLFIAYICGIMLGIVSCSNQNVPSETKDEVTVYGSVIDASTGDPLYNAQIYLTEWEVGIVGSTVTGQDGTYEFSINKPNRGVAFLVEAEKDGYKDDQITISFKDVTAGGKMKVDFRLIKK